MILERKDKIQLGVCSSLCAGAAAWVGYRCWRQAWEREKPQRRFKVVHAGNSDAEFPHLVLDAGSDDTSGEVQSMKHPYHHVIEKLKGDCTLSLYQQNWDRHKDLEGLPWVWVKNRHQLMDLVEILQGLSQFSVDTEHHKHRSYRGFICLIQIFTGECTYLVDAIALHDDLHVLNKVFSDPKIQKVAHGCHNDVMWLQQDFRVYMVNVFDTEKACQVLNKTTRNLAYLLKQYFGQKSNKSLQVADWRHRPLNEAQISYAIMDVKYLLSLKEILMEELIAQDCKEMEQLGMLPLGSESPSLQLANTKSQELCLGMYQNIPSKEAVTAAAMHLVRKHMVKDGALDSLSDSKLNSSNVGCDRSLEDVVRNAIYQLCSWRDKTARQEDESCEFILKTRILMALAIRLPQSAKEVMSIATRTPIHELLPGEVDCRTQVKLWNPPRAFTSQVGEIAELIRAAVTGEFVWVEGMAMMERSRNSKNINRDAAQAARERNIEALTSKSQVYENCQMLGADGTLLCYCDRRRMEWYLKKELAIKIRDSPFTIQLLFQHRTTDEESGAHSFYVQSRQNRCVGCGEEGHFLRYKVVPSCYRRHFPVHMKSHRSHDVVLLCLDCHHEAQIAADQLKKVLAKEYAIPLQMPRTTAEAANWAAGGEELDVPAGGGCDGAAEAIPFSNIRGAASALKKHSAKIPETRKKELEGIIHQYLGRNPADEDGLWPGDIEKAENAGLARRHTPRRSAETAEGTSTEGAGGSEGDFRHQDGGHAWHGEQVVLKILETCGEAELHNLIRRFRVAFVERVEPQFLPHKWTVDHCASRHFGQHSIFYQKNQEASSSGAS